jgi:periplasmic divalent cation tolerance protein
MSEQEGVLVVLVTAPDLEHARAIGRALVEERLAACVNLIPGIESIYRWQGKVSQDAEVLLVVKSQASRLPALAARVKELHPYELPEVLALPAAGGSQAYLDWVLGESR